MHTRERLKEVEEQLEALRTRKQSIPASWYVIIGCVVTVLTAVGMPVGHALIYQRFVSRAEYEANTREISTQLRATAELTSRTAVILDAHLSTPLAKP